MSTNQTENLRNANSLLLQFEISVYVYHLNFDIKGKPGKVE